MTPLFKKLNYKNQKEIVVLNSPDSFNTELNEMGKFSIVKTNLKGIKSINFILIFVQKKMEIENSVQQIFSTLADDAILWFAYPKGSSKIYKCDFNRDNGWNSLGEKGFEGVRIVAIDKDWSALRFRKVENIKVMKRSKSMTLSKDGMLKTKGK